ncbi:MAG: peptide deformylase [Candidatus Woesearchaeota archaeon]
MKATDIFTDPLYAEWVLARAKPLTDFTLLPELVDAMDHLAQENNWAAVSSNNVYWEKIESPVRVVRLVEAEVTLVNPKVMYSSASIDLYVEGCGSLGATSDSNFRPQFVVPRHSSITVEAGRRRYKFSGLKAEFVRHELDHLNGVLIAHRGFYCGSEPKRSTDFSSLVDDALSVGYLTFGRTRVLPPKYVVLSYSDFKIAHGYERGDAPVNFIVPHSDKILEFLGNLGIRPRVETVDISNAKEIYPVRNIV